MRTIADGGSQPLNEWLIALGVIGLAIDGLGAFCSHPSVKKEKVDG